MILSKRSLTFLALLASLVSACVSVSRAQPSADLARFQARYPGNPVITESAWRDVTISLSKAGVPEMKFAEYSSLYVLTDNATVLSDSKEYFNTRLEVKDLSAYSLVPAGNSYRKYPVTNFTKTQELGNGVFYDDTYMYIFNFPSAGKGTKLVTTSETVARDAFYPILFFFGSSVPVEQARFSLTIPDDVTITYKLFGEDTALIHLTKTRKGKLTTWEWSCEELKSYVSDDQSPSARYFTPHIMVNIAGYTCNGQYFPVLATLKDLYAWDYSNLRNLNTEPSDEIQRLTDSLTAGVSTDREKVRRLFSWVQKNIKYVAIEDGDNGFVPRNASGILQRRYGDCKDKSSILNAMMKAAGLKTSMAWVGTRSLPYKYSEFPSMSCSNHMVAVWWETEDHPLILDGTTRYHALNEIPSSIQGKECLIEKGSGDFMLYAIPVAAPEENVWADTLCFTLTDGILKGTGKAVITGEKSAELAEVFESTDSLKYKDVLNNLMPMASNKFSYTSVRIQGLRDPDSPLTVSYSFDLPDYLTLNNGSAYVNLNTERFMAQKSLATDRRIPLEEETPFIRRYVGMLTIPENYSAANLPADISFDEPKFWFRQTCRQIGNTVVLTNEIRCNFQLISGEEINRFREMLTTLNKGYTRSIVLKKN
jgi:hypothetical protein